MLLDGMDFPFAFLRVGRTSTRYSHSALDPNYPTLLKMKTSRKPHLGFLSHGAQAVILFIGFALNAVALSQENAVNVSATKDHVLFVGTDLSVKQDGKFYHVVGANKKTLKIEKDHALAEVRLSGGASIRINKGVKLSNLSATIGHLQTESIDRESARAQLAAMQASMALMDESGDHEDRLHGTVTLLSAVGINPDAAGGAAASRANLDAIQASASAAYISALPDLARYNSSVSTLFNQSLMQPGLDDEVTLDASALPGLHTIGGSGLSDSGAGGSSSMSFSPTNAPSASIEVELTFDVSSPEPLDNAYIVVVANYASLSKPGEVARQISAREFARIDSQPKQVKMTHAASLNGLPFKKFDMGLFANGQEVATNLSEKRMALTSDQAFQFFLIDYLSTHKGATRPPTPMLMTPRTEFRRDLATIETNQTIYANVDKMGNTLAISTDAGGKQPVPASVESALRNVRFLPALNNGAPVDGRVKVTLAQLTN
jgi:hypothetical protein